MLYRVTAQYNDECRRLNDPLSILLTCSFLIRLSVSSLKIPAIKSSRNPFTSLVYAGFRIMKSKNLQKIVLSKYQNSGKPTGIHRDLNDGIDLRTIKKWCQMIRLLGSIALSTPSGCDEEKSINSKTIDEA